MNDLLPICVWLVDDIDGRHFWNCRFSSVVLYISSASLKVVGRELGPGGRLCHRNATYKVGRKFKPDLRRIGLPRLSTVMVPTILQSGFQTCGLAQCNVNVSLRHSHPTLNLRLLLSFNFSLSKWRERRFSKNLGLSINTPYKPFFH